MLQWGRVLYLAFSGSFANFWMELFFYLSNLHVYVFFLCFNFIKNFAGVLSGLSLKSSCMMGQAGVESMCRFFVSNRVQHW
jgi:hypothetical protein